jgi:uncharacterized coiled-coil protein SlyX
LPEDSHPYDQLRSRIEKLEIELVHLQRFTEQLNQVVAEQSSDVLKLTRTVDRLTKHVTELRKRPDSSEPPPTLEEEKPPHY